MSPAPEVPEADGRAATLAVALLRAGATGRPDGDTGHRLLTELRRDPAVCAASLDLLDPLDGDPRTVVSVGYRHATLSFLRSPAFLRDDPGYRLLRTRPEHPARSWRDVDGYERGRAVARVFRPAGYTGGATARLVTPEGRYVGNLHLSTAGGAVPGPALVSALNLAAGTLATLLAPPQLPVVAGRQEAAVLLDGDRARPVAGRPHPAPATLAAARALDPGVAGSAYRTHRDGRWLLVRLVPRPDGLLVTEQPGDPPHELSHRELEVLTLLVEGTTTRVVARRLGIAERTAARHVERILAKLSAPSRAAAVAVALADGLRLLPEARSGA